nr:uncharacterized protein LOC109169237 isoform X2 [Ipomoea batatas]
MDGDGLLELNPWRISSFRVCSFCKIRSFDLVLHISLIVVTIIFFYRNKRSIHVRDISVTYILLGGAVLLDSIAMVKLVFSEWTVVIMKDAQ